ncbi:hypothetical protein M1116_01350 [Patescibacteria group bacterium]|nr:hypothetical protein [Patescibacteria group bacterium]
MIGNPDWFTIRKWGGWGLTPKTWQGWVYILVMVLPLVLVTAIFRLSPETIKTVTLVWVSIIMLDVFDMMIHLKRDEREEKHEALAERNAAWFIVFILAFGMIIKALVTQNPDAVLDPVILTALFGGVLVKALTHFYLRDK